MPRCRSHLLRGGTLRGRGVAESLEKKVEGGVFGAVGRVALAAHSDPAAVTDDLDAARPLHLSLLRLSGRAAGRYILSYLGAGNKQRRSLFLRRANAQPGGESARYLSQLFRRAGGFLTLRSVGVEGYRLGSVDVTASLCGWTGGDGFSQAGRAGRKILSAGAITTQTMFSRKALATASDFECTRSFS